MKSVNLAIASLYPKLVYWNSIFYANKFFLHGRSHKIFLMIGRSEKTNLNKEKKSFCWIWEPAMKDTVPCQPYLHTAFASTPPQQLIVSPAVGRCHHEKRWQHEVNALSASCFMHLKNLRLPTLQHETCRKTEHNASPSQLTQSLHTRQITFIKKNVITIKL